MYCLRSIGTTIKVELNKVDVCRIYLAVGRVALEEAYCAVLAKRVNAWVCISIESIPSCFPVFVLEICVAELL